jgi:inosine-uridine nucleoside N-ribohydrolase
MARKVILDVDPGIIDALALTLALFDPEVEVVAVTAVAGNVSAEQATRNVQTIIEQLDPPRWPRIGVATAGEQTLPASMAHLFGTDGLGQAGFPMADLHHQHPAEKVIADEIKAAPESVTIVALGPLSNIARAFRRDPALAALVGQIVIAGGTVAAPGNATATAEFNIHSDPLAAREVFQSRTTKTLVPLDVTAPILMTFDLLDQLPEEYTRAGAFLRKMLPFAFRSYRHHLGLEGIHLHEVVALLAATRPDLFATENLAADVETSGELTFGATVFDRRPIPEWRANMDVALKADGPAILKAFVRGLGRAGEHS